jgi:hypothetical protein
MPQAQAPRPPTLHLGVRPAPRAPTQILQQPQQQHLVAQPAVDPGTPRRQAGYAQRRNVRPRRAPGVRVNRFTITEQSWLNYVFGVAIVALIGMVSIWGFVEMSNRLGGVRPRGGKVVKVQQQPQTAQAQKPKKAVRIKNGTPVVVKQTTKKSAAPVVAAAVQPAPKAAPVKQPKKPKTKLTVTPVPSPAPADPNLAVETVEIKKAPATTEPVPTTTQPEKVALEEPVVTAKEPPTRPEPPTTKPPTAMQPPTPKMGVAVGSFKAKITVASDPAAEIYLDGRKVGTTVDATLNSGWIETKSGKHRLELRRQGYTTYRTVFELAPDDARNLPRVNLEPMGNAVAQGNAANAAQAPIAPKGTALTLRVSTFPAQVTIRNLDNNNTQAFTMKAASRVVQLDSGRYQVKVERKGETKERELNLTGGQGQLTFTADFKGE